MITLIPVPSDPPECMCSERPRLSPPRPSPGAGSHRHSRRSRDGQEFHASSAVPDPSHTHNPLRRAGPERERGIAGCTPCSACPLGCVSGTPFRCAPLSSRKTDELFGLVCRSRSASSPGARPCFPYDLGRCWSVPPARLCIGRLSAPMHSRAMTEMGRGLQSRPIIKQSFRV